jgi:hypothetical protein
MLERSQRKRRVPGTRKERKEEVEEEARSGWVQRPEERYK